MSFWRWAKGFQPKSPVLFGCNQCGECCREMQVPLNHQDLLRIYRQEPERPLLEWLQFRPVEKEHPEALWLDGIPGVLILRQRQGACVFLGAEQQCQLYSVRPRVCRIWPLEHRPGERALRVAPQHEMLVRLACDRTPVSAETVAELQAEMDAIARDYRAYALLVARWNAQARETNTGHGLAGFVRFLSERM